MSVISSKRKAVIKRIHAMMDDAVVIRLCKGLCRDAESVSGEWQRQVTAILAENNANTKKCIEFTIQIERYGETNIEQSQYDVIASPGRI